MKLERVEEQFEAFVALTESECQQLLGTTLSGIEAIERGGRSPGEELIQLYLAGDEDALHKHAERFIPGGPELVHQLVGRRNLRMANRIDDTIRARQHTKHLFAIGAGHLGGPDGVIARLRNRGVSVTRVVAEDKDARR